MKLNFAKAALLLLFPFASLAADGSTVYTWTDAEGVRYFSDTRPPETGPGDADFQTITLENLSSDTDPAADYYSVTNQWQRMQKEKAAREEYYLEREKNRIEQLHARQVAREAEQEAAPPAEVRIGGFYPVRHYPRPNRPAPSGYGYYPTYNGLPPGIHSEQLLINQRLENQRREQRGFPGANSGHGQSRWPGWQGPGFSFRASFGRTGNEQPRGLYPSE